MSLSKVEYAPRTNHRDEIRMECQMEESGFNALRNQGALSAQEAMSLAQEATEGGLDFENPMSPEEAKAELMAQIQEPEMGQNNAMELAFKQAMEMDR